MTHTRHGAAVVLAYFLIYVVWGSTYYFIGVALHDIPTFLLGALRFSAAGLLLLALCGWRGERVMRPQLIRAVGRERYRAAVCRHGRHHAGPTLREQQPRGDCRLVDSHLDHAARRAHVEKKLSQPTHDCRPAGRICRRGAALPGTAGCRLPHRHAPRVRHPDSGGRLHIVGTRHTLRQIPVG